MPAMWHPTIYRQPQEAGKRIAPLRADNPLDLPELINALKKDKVHEAVYETGGRNRVFGQILK